MRIFQQRLAEEKARRKLSLSQMSKLCGIPKSTLDGYLKGVSPTLENIVKICDGLGTSLNILLAELDGSQAGKSTAADMVSDALFAAAKSELVDFFNAAATYPEILRVNEGLINGRTSAELADTMAKHIADVAAGALSVISVEKEGKAHPHLSVSVGKTAHTR